MEEERSMHRLCRTLAFAAVATALVLAASSSTYLAQDDPYALSYYDNAHTSGAPDATLRLINDGTTEGTLCANLYVFNGDQEMEECCSCPITPDGLLTYSVNANVTGNPLTGGVLKHGVIKLISGNPDPTCNPAAVAVQGGLRGWVTHIQKGTGTSFVTTEEELSDSFLSRSELGTLELDCAILLELEDGQGACSCPPEVK
jgi:hypothetical protein